MTRVRSYVTAAIVLAATGGTAQAQHFDIRPRVPDGKIVTAGYDDATSEEQPVVRVFGYDFAEDPADPFFAQDPGFNSPAGSGLPGGSQLRFNLRGPLSYWDGSGSPAFAAPPDEESILLNFGANNRTVDQASGFQSGFSLQTVSDDGSVHRHLNAFLQGSDDNAVPAGPGDWGPGDGVEASQGIYLFEMELTSSDAAIDGSDPFWIVFNNGLDEEIHDAAIVYVEETIVPEPGSGGLAFAALATLLRRKRQRA